ncbi:MAG: type II toxin-antitoxin system Phd/YefM family antitoxin [Kiritimatiellae bacterium]|nr:type II toxin-antitoxin system Phd/YefM family antitoxin [Kiritimatiellia bacterium]
MKTIGIFEVKTRLSEICEEVARLHEPVLVTKRGKALVRIDPLEGKPMTVMERRAQYMTRHGAREKSDTVDFEPPARSRETTDFSIEEP